MINELANNSDAWQGEKKVLVVFNEAKLTKNEMINEMRNKDLWRQTRYIWTDLLQWGRRRKWTRNLLVMFNEREINENEKQMVNEKSHSDHQP